MRRISLMLLPMLMLATAHAQNPDPIERVRITDNDLGCQQIFDERNEMDKAIASAKTAQSSGQTTAIAGQAAGVAAEVASRSGMFGAIGGLTGHLFGSAASKAAANVAEQSGQQDAANAAQREKQAQERKDHLTQLFLAKGCSASDPSAPAKNPAAGILAPEPTAKAAVASPPPSFAEPVLNVINGDNLKDIKRVAVASFTVQFTEAQLGEVTDRNKIKSPGAFDLVQVKSRAVGVDFTQALPRNRMQETANALYRDFLGQLAAAGLEVVPPEKLQAMDNFKAMAARAATTPREEDAEAQKGSGSGAIRSVFMGPPGLPLVIRAGAGSESIDWLNKGDSGFSPSVTDWTLTFAGRLSLYTNSFYYQERDLQKELDAATLHVRVFVPLALIEVDQGMNWSKARIEPGVRLGHRFTRMTVGNKGSYSYVFLKEDLKVPGVIDYTVEEAPHPNAARALLGEKTRSYPATMHVENYWRDVPAASRHVFRSFIKTLGVAQ